MAFSSSGRVLWTYTPGRDEVRDRRGLVHRPPYFVADFGVIPASRPEDIRIAVSSTHNLNAPTEVAILTPGGKKVGEYWHPGHLDFIAVRDIDGDTRPELLLAGVNNGEHAATILAFDPFRVQGTPAVELESGYGLSGFPPGTEKVVILIPRSCVALTGEYKTPYNRVGRWDFSKYSVTVITGEDEITGTERFIYYEFDSNLQLLGVSPSVSLQRAHEKLEREKLLDHPMLPGDLQRLKDNVIIRRPSPAGPLPSSAVPAPN
jgi:hypothetical protein